MSGVDPIEAFRARCAAVAYLYAVGEYDLQEAVDTLQVHAARHGVVAAIGQDEVQAIMANGFQPGQAAERAV